MNMSNKKIGNRCCARQMLFENQSELTNNLSYDMYTSKPSAIESSERSPPDYEGSTFRKSFLPR